MTCRDVIDQVESFAAGDQQPDEAARAHLETCPRCASALADARRIETFLMSWPAPQAPARFTAAVQHRIRSLRWQSEVQIDRVFNAAMVVSALLVVIGVAGMLNVGSVVALAATLADVLAWASRAALQKALPATASYVAAMGLLASALVMWWWTEGTFDR
jgi:anti-sigma factor RsiW